MAETTRISGRTPCMCEHVASRHGPYRMACAAVGCGCQQFTAVTAGRSPDAPTDRAGDGHRQTAAAAPSEERLAEYQRAAEVSLAVQRAYQRGYEAGQASMTHPEHLAAAEQRGRDETARKVAAELDRQERHCTDCRQGYPDEHADLRAALADRSEATP